MKERYSDIMKLTAEELVKLAVNGNGPAFTALWDKNIESLRQFLKLGMKIKNDIDSGTDMGPNLLKDKDALT